MLNHSYLSNADVDAVDHMYEQYKADKSSVDESWQRFFEGFDLAYGDLGLSDSGGAVSGDMLKEINVLNLINDGYRTRGHLFTKTNPVRARRTYTPDLAIENFGLSKGDLDKKFNAGVAIGIGPAKLKDIIAHCEATYCQSIGVEYMYMADPKRIEWLQSRMEKRKNQPDFTLEQKKLTLEKLNEAVAFENFLHTKYVGQKRFSLEGLETLIPALDSVIELGASHGVQEFVIGMAHRGRLNVLANIMQKSYAEIFNEFEGKAYEESVFEGDVKYHMGYTSLVKTSLGKNVKLNLCPNPSHLEAVDPVVQGITRAKLDMQYGNDLSKITPILIHGDAAVAGQGIVYEVLQMAGLDAYNVGGILHLVTNNQIGFTTNYTDARTSIYCTDVAKTTKCPVFHVNGDDVEALVYTIKLALEYRQTFHSDVFIDILGYRKYGHNEGDEPKFTQPALYKAIAKHPNPREIYANKLAEQGSIEANLAKSLEKEFKAMLQQDLEAVRANKEPKNNNLPKNTWSKIKTGTKADFELAMKTAVTKKALENVAKAITEIPVNYLPIKKVTKLYADRKIMVEEGKYDWAMGELMAYGSLLEEGHPVRVSGQDVERGTFSHRHAVVKTEEGEKEYVPLNNISDKQQKFEIYNSLLSEYAVLGFEYGYSMTSPKGLTIWEAQFGDFSNGCQVTIDQFIASGETKWGRYSGLVMLLPHGYEGQGPEHSSARLERYLQLCATGNMQVMNLTTPANLFHAFRRQLKRDFRKPLIIMSPKSLLRHPLATSTTEEFTKGVFQEVIDDTYVDTKKVKRVNLCAGKIYYDLLAKQQEDKRTDVAVVRIEQLYPMPESQIEALFKKYPKAEFTWVQEEPKNMGAWTHILRYDWARGFKEITRRSSASPATGYANVHKKEQEAIINEAFNVSKTSIVNPQQTRK
ncbi:2-oxoglutarate dehydrogenase E1 component [Bacteroidia bacterium]|nr:2-oxoglutarate dehydrogenase E1 component [Bacteroidia bacterium]MDB4107409.1 2-oxoglutarate dehydrogenase E1 component [Bacteroidia bacterium]MDB9883286.1 2-oxoglutarate dehydrogenase E1 component [Bacteroidia bacterium]